MPTHACSCVGIWHMSVGSVLGTHLLVASLAQSPAQSYLSTLKVGYGKGGLGPGNRVGNPCSPPLISNKNLHWMDGLQKLIDFFKSRRTMMGAYTSRLMKQKNKI